MGCGASVVFNMGASFDNHNVSAHGCLLDGDEWRLEPDSPYIKTGSNCSRGVGYTGRTGHIIVAAPPSVRNVTVGFTGGPQVFSMQDSTSGSVRVHRGATSTLVPLAANMPGKYQVLATANFRSGGVWAPSANRTRSSFVLEWDVAAPDDDDNRFEIDWEVRTPPWPGNPIPGPM